MKLKIEHRWESNKSINKINPEVSYAGYVTTNDAWRQEPLYASYSRLYYIISGSGMLISDDESIPLEPGYVYLAPCGMKCGFYGTPAVTKVFFHINLSLPDENTDVFASFGHFIRLPRRISLLNKMKEWYLSPDKRGHLMLKCEIMNTVCEIMQTSEEKYGQNRNFSPSVIAAINYIRTHLTASLSVTEVAEACLCSKSTLSTLFKNEVGHSVAKYTDDLLLSEAQTLLLYSDKSIGAISELLGFCDQFYFSRWFTKRFKISPIKYRKQRSDIITQP